jgi:monomeric sarcosine oxidase
MHKPNVNTFAPDWQICSPFELVPCHPGAKIIVVGSGAFGGWIALTLQRKKYNVTLVDAWGAGNSRSSSGDETRVIRSTYGNNQLYFDLNVRALERWKAFEKECHHKIFFNVGVLWLCHEENTPMVDDSIPFAEAHEMAYQLFDRDALTAKYPFINTSDLHHAYLDPFGGFLRAKAACQLVKEMFIKEGGEYLLSYVKPGIIKDNRLATVELHEGSRLSADTYIFACGSWLGKVFPEVLSSILECTKQEVYYFGIPAFEASLYDTSPVWVDVDGIDFYYGIPPNNGSGFKIGVDKRGDRFDPTGDERVLNPVTLERARAFMSHRFPGLHDAPLLENRVCPYESTPDGNFIIDNHPEASNVVIVGGGSGHGFKHGPAVGELVALGLSGDRRIPGLFSLKRFSKK